MGSLYTNINIISNFVVAIYVSAVCAYLAAQKMSEISFESLGGPFGC